MKSSSKNLASEAVPPRRRPANLSIREDVREAARARGINISQVAEAALVDAIRRHDAELWRAENADAIEAFNERIKGRGLFNDRLRRF